MKVKVIKPFRYGLRVFEVGEVGEVVNVDIKEQLTWEGRPLYDYYVRFPDHFPIGVHKEEVQQINK